MVRRHEEHNVWYSCGKCHSSFDTREEAECCENQEATMQLLRGESFKEDVEWKVGDFLWILKQGNLPELVRIEGTVEIRHKIWPKFKDVTGEVYNYDTWHTKWVRVVTDPIKEIILEWAKELKGGD